MEFNHIQKESHTVNINTNQHLQQAIAIAEQVLKDGHVMARYKKGF
jgi:hypothetical protein